MSTATANNAAQTTNVPAVLPAVAAVVARVLKALDKACASSAEGARGF